MGRNFKNGFKQRHLGGAFLGMLVYQLKDSAAREKKYQETIQKLTKHLEVLNDLQEDVNEIKDAVLFKKRRINEPKEQTEKL